ncbi:class I SAM-dependent methyltransferase [Bradyrhizobium sp. Ai1a-2]|uniref:class I SAM-dependent methyltransferase n=1 Tax=Bradyrhizobium sp. Ai1a-2 TaxID=196490 RepID=UPI0004890ADC|nr:class I SAM-dependent methyltransferase [Bradyrhizobium sp. Ai1a-2]
MAESLAPIDACIFESPNPQFAIDLIEGWTSAFPSEAKVTAGTVNLFADDRAKWAFTKIRADGRAGVEGMDVLELGPLEGAHTYMLQQAGAKCITAIEANKRLFMKCLITKEVLGMDRTKFMLGDFMPWLGTTNRRFDLVWCTGVLYHMPEPLKLLHAVSKVTDRVHIWTHYVDEAGLDQPWASPIIAPDDRNFMGRTVRHYRRSYHDAAKSKTYCGGVYNEASWITKGDILKQLEIDGFKSIDIAFDTHDNPNGPCFALVAQR